MRKFRAKLTVLLTAICCVFAILGVSASIWHKSQTVSAATDVVIESIDESTTTASCIYTVSNVSVSGAVAWEHFKFVSGTGSGFSFNDKALETYAVQPYDDMAQKWYFAFGTKEASVGDEVSVDGTFRGETSNVEVVFDNVGFRYLGDNKWEIFASYERIDIYELASTSDSSAAVIYAYDVEEKTAPNFGGDWNKTLSFKDGSGKGFLLNGQEYTNYVIKKPGNDYFIDLKTTATRGTSVTLDGIFYSDELRTKFVFHNCSLVYIDGQWKAYSVYLVSSLDISADSSDRGIYASLVGEEMPSHDNSTEDEKWAQVFTFEEGSGDGFLFNGREYSTYTIKQPGRFYIDIQGVAKAGDEVIIDGIFSNANWGIQFFFERCGLRYNGSAWEFFQANTTYQLGKVTLSAESLEGGDDAKNDRLYLRDENGDALLEADATWSTGFTFKTGGLKLNGKSIANGDIKNPGYLYIGFNAVNLGDCITVEGVIVNDEKKLQYVIDKNSFVWTGNGWAVGESLGEVSVQSYDSANNSFYLNVGKNSPFDGDEGWAHSFSYFSGNGITVDGNQVDYNNNVKFVGSNIYLDIHETPVRVGTVLKIGGILKMADINAIYSFSDVSFVYTGSEWKKCIEIGKATSFDDGTIDAGYVAFEKTSLPISSWSIAGNNIAGVGATVDGKSINMTNNFKSVSNKIYVENITGVKENSILTIGGIFHYQGSESGISYDCYYVVENSAFVWNGSSWQYFAIETKKLGAVTGTRDTVSDGVCSSYIDFKDPSKLTVSSWDYAFAVLGGNGITVDGVQIDYTNNIKSVGGSIYVTMKGEGITVKKGSNLKIAGLFLCRDYEGVNYVYEISESLFTWDGEKWGEYQEYKPFNCGTLLVGNPSKEGSSHAKNSELYLSLKEGSFPCTEWENPFVLESGDGLTIGSEKLTILDMQSADGYLYLRFDSVEVGTEITISGVFICQTKRLRYTIESHTFVWTGSGWEYVVDYGETINVGRLNASAKESNYDSTQFNFNLASGMAFEITSWTHEFFVWSGSVGVSIQGKTNSASIKFPGQMFLDFENAPALGDVLVIEGIFYCPDLAVKYQIEKSVFAWNGNQWIYVYSDDQLEYYDVVTIIGLGQSTKETIEGTYDGSGLKYLMSDENTTGSVKFRFGYTTDNVRTGSIDIRLRGAAWTGYQFHLEAGSIYLVGGTNMTASSVFANGRESVVELGAIDTKDGKVWIYISIDGNIRCATTMDKGEYRSSQVSVYFGNVALTTITDPDNVKVTYTHAGGSFSEYALRNGEYAIAGARSSKAFVGWANDGTLYGANQIFNVGDEDVEFIAVELDFKLEEGASILISETSEKSGIRFTAFLKEEDLDALSDYGVQSVAYGILITPYDYLKYGQAPNLDDFKTAENGGTTAQKDLIVKLSSKTEVKTVEKGYIVFRGAMRNMYTSNYERLFAGRGYVEITLASGETLTVYTPFSIDENVRSIHYVAQRYQETTAYENLTSNKKAVVDAYASRDVINVMNYSKYQANGYFSATAWYYPELDPSNRYMNDKNKSIAEKMLQAGIKVVYLDGQYHLNLDKQENIEKTRQIIEYFWSYGIYSIAFGSNASTTKSLDYGVNPYPDFSDLEGFIGFLVWDEPKSDSMNDLAKFAENFENTYAGTGVTFMANLLPSYSDEFKNGSAINKGAYQAYLQGYIDTVLSKISGEKWLSMDSYPIYADYSLGTTFLFDLAMLKYYSLSTGATSHAVLQSSGWFENNNYDKNRMPTEAEMRMQAYTAMAFGIDSISWWSYSDKRNDNQYNPTDNDDYYNRFATVNNELAYVSAIYKAFNWKGIILGAEKQYLLGDDDYAAIDVVKGTIGNYELSVSKTKNLSAVSTDKKDLNYLMGVMEDMNGNESYVLVNYNNHEENRAQTITLTFKTNVTEVIIYRGGSAQTITVNGNSISVALATGEGVIVLPSKLG